MRLVNYFLHYKVNFRCKRSVVLCFVVSNNGMFNVSRKFSQVVS